MSVLPANPATTEARHIGDHLRTVLDLAALFAGDIDSVLAELEQVADEAPPARGLPVLLEVVGGCGRCLRSRRHVMRVLSLLHLRSPLLLYCSDHRSAIRISRRSDGAPVVSNWAR